MSGRTRSAARLAGVAAVLVLAAGSAAAAGPGTRYREKAASLRAQAGALDSRAHRALLDLYALDTRYRTAQARLASLRAQAARLRIEQAQLAQQVSVTRRTLSVSRQRLGDNLRLLYKQGDVNALAVVLGAQSLDDAMTRLDDLSRVADQSRQVVEATTQAQTKLTRLRATLAARRAQVNAAVASAQRSADELAAARSERISFIGRLRSEQQLKTSQIAALETTAQRVERKSQEIQAAALAGNAVAPAPIDPAPTTTDPAGAPAPAPAPSPGGRTLIVSSTGYSLPGHTATGMPVGWGVVAVDPAVIPLGTRLTIPGYGEGVAADTGSAVRGADIDLWFPTLAQARAWGRRTVTITLH